MSPNPLTPPPEFTPAWVRDYVVTVLPPSWRVVAWGWDGAKYLRVMGGLSVITSGKTERDGKRWWHVSCAYPDRLPRWSDLREVKDLFIGKEKKAVQVLPAESEYVNIHPYCLHLWHCLDEDVTPDFRGSGGML
jgi:hypothetical protein